MKNMLHLYFSALAFLKRLQWLSLCLPVFMLEASSAGEVYRKCVENSREVHQARLGECRSRGAGLRCRRDAEKEKKELLDYCTFGVKQQPAAVVITSH
jgi:hypothetical protein